MEKPTPSRQWVLHHMVVLHSVFLQGQQNIGGIVSLDEQRDAAFIHSRCTDVALFKGKAMLLQGISITHHLFERILDTIMLIQDSNGRNGGIQGELCNKVLCGASIGKEGYKR